MRRPALAVPALLVAAAAALGAGCSGGPGGYGVHFAMVIDSTISDSAASSIRSLEIATLSSVEPFYTKVPTDDRFDGRKAEITYRPQITAGTLAFSFRVRDGNDGLVGVGGTEVKLAAGTITDVTVTLVNPDSLPVDMGPRYDFSVIDLAMPDLVPPPPAPDMARIRDFSMGPVDMAMPPSDMAVPVVDDMTAPPPPPDLSTED